MIRNPIFFRGGGGGGGRGALSFPLDPRMESHRESCESYDTLKVKLDVELQST